MQFAPVPFGQDLYAQFGDEFGVPIAGNFDPPSTLDGQATASPGGSAEGASVWRNAKNPLDTTDDGLVSARDALVIINFIDEFGIGAIPSLTPNPLQGVFYLDVSGNLGVEPQDALLVINYLSDRSATAGEGEAPAPAAQLVASFAPLESVSAARAAHVPTLEATSSADDEFRGTRSVDAMNSPSNSIDSAEKRIVRISPDLVR